MPKIKKTHHHPITIVLCDIRSAQNAGAIMRTADAIGAADVVFAGYTPGPRDRFGRENRAFIKASLGAERTLSWRHVDSSISELKHLKKEGAYIIAVEQSRNSVDYKSIKLPHQSIVVVFGNEVTGLPKTILSLADLIAEIPQRGQKESLNVSVAAGIVLFRWFDQ